METIKIIKVKRVKNKQFIRLVFKLLFTKNVLVELLNKTPKNKKRKVCSQCHELGHGIASVVCKVKIEENNKLKNKIKEYILSQDLLTEKTIDEYCHEWNIILQIEPSLCKTLYNEISPIDLLDRPMNIESYLKNIEDTKIQCHECDKKLCCLQINTNRIWKGNTICDTCWCKYDDERNKIWEEIKKYKPTQCEICCSVQVHIGERYHYDHLNMFDKNKSICSMVNEGIDIEEIYKEIDKCQILCLRCHHIVTDIERKIGFTRVKQVLTRQLNQNEISVQEYYDKTITYQKLYEEKMLDIYKKIKWNLNQKTNKKVNQKIY
jgi:hypothetical protein